MFKSVFNNNIMLIAVFLCVSFFSLFFGINMVHARERVSYEKTFTTIEISNGDTLTSIAHEYCYSAAHYEEYIEEIKSINNLKNDIIHAGCYLMIPIYTKVV